MIFEAFYKLDNMKLKGELKRELNRTNAWLSKVLSICVVVFNRELKGELNRELNRTNAVAYKCIVHFNFHFNFHFYFLYIFNFHFNFLIRN